MKKRWMILSAMFPLLLCSCTDWLTETAPGTESLDDYFTGGEKALAALTACYVPLMWEFGEGVYYPEWFIGDVASDDAVKGGQNISDIPQLYDLENFKTNADNASLLRFYRAQYEGVGRCNLALAYIPGVETDDAMDGALRERLLGEAYFLRALYYFRLVRIFGGVPRVDFIVDSSSKWQQPRASAAEIYALIVSDLEEAEKRLWNKSQYLPADVGRATKGAAQAMLMKAYLHGHAHFTDAFQRVETWGGKIVDGGEYALNPDYADNFTLAGENGPESVFEIQYSADPMSDYGEGEGFTRGTFTVIMTRSRSQALMGHNTGWGFNKPSQNLYDAYESGDPRRDASIINPADDQLSNPATDIYMGMRYCNRKYAMMTDSPQGGIYGLSHHSRGPVNNRVIRYADVLLMYAEACCETGNTTQAKWALEAVRARARGMEDILPEFPGYNGYADTQEDLRRAIRHERRVELAMEAHRWFDLIRWGEAAATMNAFRTLPENNLIAEQMSPFIAGVHELFPIPAEERRLGNLDQNPGYN